MPKYFIKASYTTEGTQGLLKEGGTSRRKAVEQLVERLDGKLEAFYYAFGGEADVIAIVDVPDATVAAALSLSINASGAVSLSTTPLLTPQEIDQACKRTIDYRPPGN